MLTSGIVGAFIGILPGIGGMTANLVAYSISKSTSKHPEKYGTGYMGGVVASETANNACVGGAMIPLFALLATFIFKSKTLSLVLMMKKAFQRITHWNSLCTIKATI